MRRLQREEIARPWALLLLATVVSGCGGLYDASVSGTVTFEGNVVPRGTVSYKPVQKGPTAYGLISEDGSYVVKVGREEGLPSGEYVVSVVANEESTPNKNPSLPPNPGKPITPRWYRSMSTSGLKYTVNAGANNIDVQLSAEPPPDWKPPRERRKRR